MDEDPLLSVVPEAVSKVSLGVVETVLADVDSDRIGGFVWKFPSEGSNARVGGPEPAAAAVPYPRKCRYCARAWVSSYVSERRHWQTCRPADQAEHETDGAASLGVARRVWCEVDAALTGIQWRDDVDAAQDLAACRVAFHEIAEVALLASPRASFQITTTSGRRIVLQCRGQFIAGEPQDEAVAPSATVTRALDARQWVEYLEMFSRFAAQHRALDTVCEEITEEPNQSVMDSTEDANEPDAELLREALRLIHAGDADALDEMLTDADVGPAARALCDTSGSSLLVQAIKLDAGASIVKTLLRAGVDANAKNHEGESPLLLAAASGDMVLLGLLLRTPTVRVNQRCALGATAFHAAANAGDVAALRAMCEHGEVSATLVDENGWTALHYAAACVAGREAMQFLCELLPELVDARCIQGNTALHVAAGYGCEPTLRVLLQTAANPHVANAEGHTAYHVALHNHHIACAIAVNEYMETPRETYERAVATAALPPAYLSGSHAKEDRIAPAETTSQAFYTPVDGEYYDYYGSAAPSAWTEYYTEDQIPYYYNTLTGESTWHMPEPLKEPSCLAAPPPPPPPPQAWPLSDEISDNATEPGGDERGHGQQLPLCMIPLVSPLVSLDDPTAATKLDSRRKRDRERRRRSKELRHRGGEPSHSASQQTDAALLLPPPPPPHEYSLTLTRARRTHSRRALFEVQ